MHHILIRLMLPAVLLAAPGLLGAQSSADSVAGMERVVSGLRPAVEVEGRPAQRWSLAERLAHHNVPGASIAVVEGGRIVWARGFGVREAGGAELVTAETLFQAASVSKMIAATATLRLVEQGRLDLDADVNRYLAGWRVPENAFTVREKVTLRRILSHSAGLTVHGFRGYRPGAALPSLVQVLEGQAPANTAPVRVDTVPGAITRYSGGGTTVQQLVLTEVTGRPFPRLAEDLVFAAAGMRHSTFQQPLAPALAARAARGHGGDGSVLPGGWPVYAEMAAGGLWTTAGDLMRWAIAIDQAHDGTPGAILSPQMAAQMLTRQSQGYGLGPEVEGEGRAFRFAHGGSNPGYRAQVTYFPETGQGAAILVSGDGGDPLIDEIQRAIAAEYAWPALSPARVAPMALDSLQVRVLAGEYAMQLSGAAQPVPARLTHQDGRWTFTTPILGEPDEVVAVSSTELVGVGWGYAIRFDLDAPGRATGFTLTYNRNVIPAIRVQ
jgi:CubicO group peptidase (beta-lactamase class C family)